VTLISGFEHIVRENEPLAPFTPLKLGGVAEAFAEPTTVEELIGLVKRFSEHGVPIRLLGGGTNLLIRDAGVAGLVIRLAAPAFCTIEINGNVITAGGGTQVSHFVASAVREGLSGPEQLVGIPGTIGGALHNNTGAHGIDIGSWVQSVDVINRAGELVTREKESLSFSYRRSSLTELVILSAKFQFEPEDSAALTKQMQKLWIVRRASQPTSDEHATYIFKDHGGDSAAALIERAGLKGTRVGKVVVSDQNPNFFVAQPGANSDQVLQLMELVRTQVAERLEIELENAIQIW
jgi:UDP-N-acetylmuramate dehydrogenase